MKKSRDKDPVKGKKYCLRLLSLRPRSEREIGSRLKAKGYSDDLCGEIVPAPGWEISAESQCRRAGGTGR